MTTKVCSICKNEKDLFVFNKSSSIKSGYRAECKQCANIKMRNYYKTHPEKYKYNPNRPEEQKAKKRITDKKYRDNSQKRKEYILEYDRTHREQKLKRGRENYHKNKERYVEYSKKYRKDHPEWHCIFQSKRRAKIKSNGGTFTTDEWKSLCAKYDFTCLKCGRRDLPLTIDHVVPINRGGNNSIDNVQPLCKSCNSSKGTKIIDFRSK